MWAVSMVCYWCVCCLEALLGKSTFSVPLSSGGCKARERGGCDWARGGHGARDKGSSSPGSGQCSAGAFTKANATDKRQTGLSRTEGMDGLWGVTATGHRVPFGRMKAF